MTFPFPYGTALSIIVVIITGAKQSHYDFSEVWEPKRFDYIISTSTVVIFDYKISRYKAFRSINSINLENKNL
jgi:hypothetical protein